MKHVVDNMSDLNKNQMTVEKNLERKILTEKFGKLRVKTFNQIKDL